MHGKEADKDMSKTTIHAEEVYAENWKTAGRGIKRKLWIRLRDVAANMGWIPQKRKWRGGRCGTPT